MWKIVSFLLIPLLLISEELEVRLATRSLLKPAYLSRIHGDTADWRSLEELRDVLEFDLNAGGFCNTLPLSEDLEKDLDWADLRRSFDLTRWKTRGIPYLFALSFSRGELQVIAFNIEQGTSKKYPAIPLTGHLEEDRRSLHRLSDTLHKDLFGVEGIASLRILYAQRTPFPLERTSEICLSDLDGANVKQLTFEQGYCVTPSFFPRSSEFFYVSFKEGLSKVYRASLSGKKPELLLSLRGNQVLPSISPQGNLFAFISDVAGRPDLFLQSLDPKKTTVGKARQLFSAPRATQASPTFSPDGEQIAFVSDKDGPPRIYLLPTHPKTFAKPRPKLLTKRNRENTSPAWSPDGTKIAYSAKTDGIRQIWVYDLATEEEIQLTQGPEMKENPTWAPDSLHLIYNTESEESCELYLLNLHDPHPIQISKGPGQKRFPCWEQRLPN